MKIKSTQGFVLFTVLVFVQIFSLLGLYGLTNALSIMKVNHHLWQREKNMQNAVQILMHLEKNSNCIIANISPIDLSHLERDWWTKHACSSSNSDAHYFYVVERLDEDPCALISHYNNSRVFIAEYYRFTLLFFPKDGSKIFLQSTVAKPKDRLFSCLRATHKVIPGMKMWREITF